MVPFRTFKGTLYPKPVTGQVLFSDKHFDVFEVVKDSSSCLLFSAISFGEKSLKKPIRWSQGVAFAHNLYGYPTFVDFGGDEKVGSGVWEPTSYGEFLVIDADNPADFSQREIR